jgi:hypothetical protein
MESDEKSLKKLLKDQKLESKKSKQEDKDLDDMISWHDLLRLSVADPETRDDDDKVLKRFKELRK